MLAPDAADRPTASEVQRHPLFWSAASRLRLLLDVSDAMEVLASEQPPIQPSLDMPGAVHATAAEQRQPAPEGVGVGAPPRRGSRWCCGARNDGAEVQPGEGTSTADAAAVGGPAPTIKVGLRGTSAHTAAPEEDCNSAPTAVTKKQVAAALSRFEAGALRLGWKPWDDRLPPPLLSQGSRRRGYNRISGRALLRFVRNTWHHHADLAAPTRRLLPRHCPCHRPSRP
jgi:hypothetical protein